MDEDSQLEESLKHVDPGIATALRRLQQHLPRAAETDTRPKAAPLPKPFQLPMWPEPVRGGPNPLLRSALFAAIHSSKRKELGERIEAGKPKQGITIAAQDGIVISYAGDQLNQYDADVFYEALHRARHHPLETECFFTGYDFLKTIGRALGKREYEDLNDSLTRLRDGRVVIEWKINGRHYVFTGGLISSYVREKNSKLYKVTFANEVKDLFAPACWTQLEWAERMALKGKPLAQWLHGYFSSHAAPLPISTAFLHKNTGSPHALLKNFRVDLKNALAKLEKTLGWQATWDGDLISLKRAPSLSQARHLAKKKSQRTQRRRNAPAQIKDLL